MTFIWRIIAFFKKLSIKGYLSDVYSVHTAVCESEKKVNLMQRKKYNERIKGDKNKIEEYVLFCKTKNLSIPKDVKDAQDRIDDIEFVFKYKNKLDYKLKKVEDKYNETYEKMNVLGEQLLSTRLDALKFLNEIETFVNSIAKYPKSFDNEIGEINRNKQEFKTACDFGEEQEKLLKKNLLNGGIGVAAGGVVAGAAPSAAMWVATTFGTASTGTAISSLSGAAASKAALAWLGHGAVAAGGTGIAGGEAILALAGPVGWSVVGASIALGTYMGYKKKMKLDEEKKEVIIQVQEKTENLMEMMDTIRALDTETTLLHKGLKKQYKAVKPLMNGDYSTFSEKERKRLGTLVNETKALSKLISKVLGA